MMQDNSAPNNLEAEISVVASIIKKPEILVEISSIIQPSDFYSETTRTIFQGLLDMHSKNLSIDSISIKDFLVEKNLINKAGGETTIMSYLNSIRTSANAIYHAQLIKEKSKKRNFQKILLENLEESKTGDFDVDEILNKTEQQLYQFSSQQNKNNYFSPIKSVLVETMSEIDSMLKGEDPRKISTGFADLDRQIYGFLPSDFIIIAARPAMGKTAFVLNIMANVAIRQKKSVAFFSLEMGKTQLGLRLLCAESGVESAKIKEKSVTDDDFTRLLGCGEMIAKSNINIDDTGVITVMDIASKARKLKEEVGLDLIIIDYLQLMQGVKYRNGDNRQQEIADISRSLKQLARELDIPIIALSQLNRSVDNRNTKKPLLSDLRESGSLEQDADIIMFLYREEYYDKETENKNICTVITAKNRNGAIGETDLFFQAKTTKFMNLAKNAD